MKSLRFQSIDTFFQARRINYQGVIHVVLFLVFLCSTLHLHAQSDSQGVIDSLELQLQIIETQRADDYTDFLLVVGGLLAMIVIMGFYGFFVFRKANIKLAQKNKEVVQERKNVEAMLTNILPEEIVQELQEKGKAQPRQFKHTTVMFTDFEGFTRISEQMPPEELVQELNTCFLVFDTIVEKYNLEKIKTIGDAYLCVGGVPSPNNEHPTNAVKAAMEMQTYMRKRYEEKTAQRIPYWKMRVGIHSGQLIAGVVGKNKFVYDIWGDTVNTASRLETGCEPGKINISGVTHRHVRHLFDCTYRGAIPSKNKHRIEMYFVEGYAQERFETVTRDED